MAKARWIDRFFEAFKAAPPAVEPAPAAALREAVGVTIDSDDDQWRRLSGDGDRDLTPITQQRMRQLANYLWQTNLLANRLIELPLAYLLAEGVVLQAKDPEIQHRLDAFWHDPINSMDIKLPKKARELAMFGEQCWPAFVNEGSGAVRLGYLDPGLIETVVVDPDNGEQPIGVVTVRDRQGRARRYRVIVIGPESIFSRRTREIRATFNDGDCFYFKINDLSSATRGVGDLLPAGDWCDAYEEYLFGEVDRSKLLRSFMWDVTLTGATPDEVKKRAAEITTPKPASVRVHNEAEIWKAESPDLNAVDTAESARLFRNHVLGGMTIPEHWYGGAGDVNRSTGDSMGDPTYKVLSMRQRTLKYMLEQVGLFVVWRFLDPAGTSDFEPLDLDETMRPEAIFPELTSKDTTAYAAALQQVVVAASMAIDKGLLTEATALRIIEAIAGRLGVEFDAVAELEAARKELAQRREADVFQQPPDPGVASGGPTTAGPGQQGDPNATIPAGG